MNQGNDRRAAVILSLIGIIPVVWLGLLIAPSVKGGLPEILTSLMNAMNDPFHIELCEDSVKAVLVLLLCYGMGVGIYFSTRRNYRRREEHGSAKWGSASAVNKKYAQQPKSENKLLTQNVAIGLNAKKHRRNLNTLVIGGSGAGKTRFFCKPNLMQCCRNSYFVLDPKGEIVRDVGELLSQKEYEVRVLDLISMEKSHSETVITETDDGNGNIVQTETTETRTTLYITVSHKTVEEIADQYGFNEEQREYLAELLEDKNNSLWAAVLYGIHYSDDQIVTVALSQVGNVGGEPYWSWYGFGSRVEWCACFVSWCANECGYIETGVIPKFAGCVNGVQWFKDRGQWIDGSAEPVSGMIIFFDWDNKGSSGPQDGQSDHVGIVQKVENGIVYTVEGNSGDSCRVNQYSVGYYEVLGYGVPQY